MVQVVQATVYKAGGRRWFTKKAALRAEAKQIYRKRYPCECDGPVHEEGYPGYGCPHHGEHQEKFVRRVARLLKEAHP